MCSSLRSPAVFFLGGPQDQGTRREHRHMLLQQAESSRVSPKHRAPPCTTHEERPSAGMQSASSPSSPSSDENPPRATAVHAGRELASATVTPSSVERSSMALGLSRRGILRTCSSRCPRVSSPQSVHRCALADGPSSSNAAANDTSCARVARILVPALSRRGSSPGGVLQALQPGLSPPPSGASFAPRPGHAPLGPSVESSYERDLRRRVCMPENHDELSK